MTLGIQKYDKEGKPICPLCSKSFHRLIAHTRQKHGLSGAKYREMFGLCKTFPILSPESKQKARDRVFENPKCIDDNLVKNGVNTRFSLGKVLVKHEKRKQRSYINQQNNLNKPTKPKAKCLVCSKELSSRKGKYCLKHYRLNMIIRNKGVKNE
jgi:ssDNA-binding Zn-finger/Zn-ribbon topoisomerase 1